jgi:large subunit ribosomal protein L29
LASDQEIEMTKTTELRSKDVAGLKTEVKALQKAHFGLRMQKATQQLSNTATLRTARRDIARAKTILVEKQSAVSPVATPAK